jgi:manganese/zinc/iron transport system permease protein
MMGEFLEILSGWSQLDSWIAATAAVASMACSVPGVFLLVRRQSMLGDTLSHTALPGIALGFLAALWFRDEGWLSPASFDGTRHLIIVLGAMLVGVLAAVLTELVQEFGQVDANAALGVVFTSLFALGLLLIRRYADRVDLDPDCVLYGTIETSVTDTVGATSVPRAIVVNGSVLVANLLLVTLFFKELRISAFDPAMATAQGINARLVYYGLTAVTAATLVAAFESVGSILVIAMLVGPAATARLLTDNLRMMIVLSLMVAGVAAVFGHASAITLPGIVFPRIGFPTVVDASTAGMIAVACGAMFLVAVLASPRYGIVSRWLQQLRLALQVSSEDILGQLYRKEELSAAVDAATAIRPARLSWLAWQWLKWQGEIARLGENWQLTARGRQHAEQLVRGHRLWETYMARHFDLPGDHLHDTAERVEHFIDRGMRGDLESELAAPDHDPHGRTIPSEIVPPIERN